MEALPETAVAIPFSADTRLSGVDVDGLVYRKGAADSIVTFIRQQGGTIPADLEQQVNAIAHAGPRRWRFVATGRSWG